MHVEVILILGAIGFSTSWVWFLLETLNDRITRMFISFDEAVAALKERVTRLTSIEESVKTTLSSLNAQLRAVKDELAQQGTTPAQLQSLSDVIDGLTQHEDSIAAAVTANTEATDANVPPSSGDQTTSGEDVPQETITGGEGDDTVSGGTGDDDAAQADDTTGGPDPDVEQVGGAAGDDSVTAGDGSDTTTASGEDTASGGAGDDSVSG